MYKEVGYNALGMIQWHIGTFKQKPHIH